MRKKSAITLLSVLCGVGALLGASACTAETAPSMSVNGFVITEALEVSVGATVELEQPIVKDETGKLLDCWTYVTDSDGNYVSATSGLFSADDVGGYTITYVVRASDNTVYEKKTVVTVNGTAAGGTLDVDYEQFITVGETVSIDASYSNENATFTYEVKKASTGETVDASNGSFTPTETGVYEVVVRVSGVDASYKYNVFAQNPMQEGEVETFDESWAEKETFVGGKRQDWTIVSSEECGLLDPYGNETMLAKYSTERAYIPLFINIRESKEYYESLKADGYEYVSMWIYMQSKTPHITISDRDPNGGFYRKDGPTLYPGEWTEFRLDLVTGVTTWYRSFTQCYSYYENQNHFYLQVDNSYEYNFIGKEGTANYQYWGGGDSITFYFTDIFAVKPVSITALTETEKTAKTGETVDLSTSFSADFDLNFALSYRGELRETTSQHMFTANGAYKVVATPASFNLRGSASVPFEVTDEFSLQGDPVIKERTGDSVSVALNDLNAQFGEVNGVTPEISDTKVYFKGEEIAVENGVFTAKKDGAYTVEARGMYELNGVPCVSYHTVPVDVFSAATKYAVIDTEYMRNIRAHDWDNTSTAAVCEEATVGGRTGEYIKLTAKGQSLTFYAKPMYSKAYYEALSVQNPNMGVRMYVYLDVAPNLTSNVKSVFTSTTEKTTWKEDRQKNWQLLEMSLSKFAAQYDTIVERYEGLEGLTWGYDTNGGAGSWMHILGSQVARTVYLDVQLGEEATAASVAKKEGANLALDVANDLDEKLNVSIDDAAGEIVKAEIYFNGAWTVLGDKTFDPTWASEYDFRFLVQTADGTKYKQVETKLTTGDGTLFTATVDTDAHTLQKNGTFDVSTLLTDDYTYEMEVFASRGGNLTAIELADGLTIKGEDLEEGSYLINVYATKGEGEFGKILYYTLMLDYFVDASELTFAETPTADTYKNIFNSYQYAAVQHLTDTTVTTACPEGNSGTFLKYEGRSDNRKEAMTYAIKPLFSKNYYQSLADSAKKYTLKFDVYLENVNKDCTRTDILYYYWNADGTKFTTHGARLTLGAWHALEIPLETLVKNLDKDVRFFGIYIPNGGYTTADLMRMYIGNIRLEEGPMQWSATPLTTAMLTSYQYASSQNLKDMSLTTEIPTGGVAGTYVKYAQTVAKEDVQLAVAPFYTQAYYKDLLDGGKKYKITYDVYVEVSNDTCTCTQLATKLWNTTGAGAQSFSTYGTVALGAWHTVEIDLQYLVDNWGNFRLFGLNFLNQANFDRSTDFVNFWLGNIQLVEGEATGVPTLKASANA